LDRYPSQWIDATTGELLGLKDGSVEKPAFGKAVVNRRWVAEGDGKPVPVGAKLFPLAKEPPLIEDVGAFGYPAVINPLGAFPNGLVSIFFKR
jgi:hypothetical protein